MGMITNDWLDAISGEFKKPYYRELYNFVREEYSKTTVYPPAEDIFNAFHFTPLGKVKVLLLGQDPYHNVNQAHGLSFSVLPEQKEIPPSFARATAILSSDTDCIIAETIGIFMEMAGSSPFLNLTSGVLRLTLLGMHSAEE